MAFYGYRRFLRMDKNSIHSFCLLEKRNMTSIAVHMASLDKAFDIWQHVAGCVCFSIFGEK